MEKNYGQNVVRGEKMTNIMYGLYPDASTMMHQTKAALARLIFPNAQSHHHPVNSRSYHLMHIESNEISTCLGAGAEKRGEDYYA